MSKRVYSNARLSGKIFSRLRRKIGWTQTEVLIRLKEKKSKWRIDISDVGSVSKWERGERMFGMFDREKMEALYELLEEQPKITEAELTELKNAVTRDMAGEAFQRNYLMFKGFQRNLSEENNTSAHEMELIEWIFQAHENFPYFIDSRIRDNLEVRQFIESIFPKLEQAKYLERYLRLMNNAYSVNLTLDTIAPPQGNTTAHINLVLGIGYDEQGNHELAIIAYQKAINIDPKYARAYNNLGIAYYEQGNYDLEIESYQRAIEIDPDHAKAYNNLGIAYYEQGNHDLAIEFYKKTLDIDPDHANAYNNLGAAYDEQSEYDLAIESYLKAITINPDYAKAHYNLGIAYYEQGKLDKAIEFYKKAICINPDYAFAYNNLGIAYYEQGKLDKAIEFYKKTLDIDPDYAFAYNSLGAAYDEQGNHDLAIESYQEAIAINPDHAMVHNNLRRAIEHQKTTPLSV